MDCYRQGWPSVDAARIGKSRVRKPGEQDAVGCRFAQDGDDGFAEILRFCQISGQLAESATSG